MKKFLINFFCFAPIVALWFLLLLTGIVPIIYTLLTNKSYIDIINVFEEYIEKI